MGTGRSLSSGRAQRGPVGRYDKKGTPLRHRQGRSADALQAAQPIERHCTSLAIDTVERVVVVMKDGAAREAPLAGVLFDQLARVAAGRKATVIAVL